SKVEISENYWHESVWAQRFDAAGSPLNDGFQVSSWSPWSSSYFISTPTPHVASDPSGNFVVAWTPNTYGVPDYHAKVMARRFDSNSGPLGEEFRVSAWLAGDQVVNGLTMSSKGFVVVWVGDGAAGPGSFGRLYDSLGNPVTSDLEFGS